MATAIHSKKSESKYVTCFADSRPDVDMTFRDVLLSRPTDHYLVGIDNFSMTNTSLSMIEPMRGDLSTLFRIVRRLGGPTAVNQDSADALDAVLTNAAGGGGLSNGVRDAQDRIVTAAGYNFEIDSNEVILSVQQLMRRLGDVASDVTDFMNKKHMSGGAGTSQAQKDEAGKYEFGGFDPIINAADGAVTSQEHLKFEVSTSGRLRIIATKAFWANFMIEIPALQNQFGFFGPRSTDDIVDFGRQRRFFCMNPADKSISFRKYQFNTATSGSIHNMTGSDPRILVAMYDGAVINGDHYNTATAATALELISYETKASIFSSLDRRVALEVGCSLPVKNSPMVDHQKESPDFVLGRWIWRSDPRIASNDRGGSRRYESNMPACTEYQGARDRVTYHELRPQAKIQTLRIKLFARIRSFDDKREQYGMRVIELPTTQTDWWHARMHFMSKD